ncbi:hypothetical protein KXV85_003516, partial [Aspergillus fumigatus]
MRISTPFGRYGITGVDKSSVSFNGTWKGFLVAGSLDRTSGEMNMRWLSREEQTKLDRGEKAQMGINDGIMTCSLPAHGRISCSIYHSDRFSFDETRTLSADQAWRITANPLAWGNTEPEVLILGFSKGPSQAGELQRLPHNEIPYRKGRKQVGKILAHV